MSMATKMIQMLLLMCGNTTVHIVILFLGILWNGYRYGYWVWALMILMKAIMLTFNCWSYAAFVFSCVCGQSTLIHYDNMANAYQDLGSFWTFPMLALLYWPRTGINWDKSSSQAVVHDFVFSLRFYGFDECQLCKVN